MSGHDTKIFLWSTFICNKIFRYQSFVFRRKCIFLDASWSWSEMRASGRNRFKAYKETQSADHSPAHSPQNTFKLQFAKTKSRAATEQDSSSGMLCLVRASRKICKFRFSTLVEGPLKSRAICVMCRNGYLIRWP